MILSSYPNVKERCWMILNLFRQVKLFRLPGKYPIHHCCSFVLDNRLRNHMMFVKKRISGACRTGTTGYWANGL